MNYGTVKLDNTPKGIKITTFKENINDLKSLAKALLIRKLKSENCTLEAYMESCVEWAIENEQQEEMEFVIDSACDILVYSEFKLVKKIKGGYKDLSSEEKMKVSQYMSRIIDIYFTKKNN